LSGKWAAVKDTAIATLRGEAVRALKGVAATVKGLATLVASAQSKVVAALLSGLSYHFLSSPLRKLAFHSAGGERPCK